MAKMQSKDQSLDVSSDASKEKLIKVIRTTSVTAGGRHMQFSAITVVGGSNQRGSNKSHSQIGMGKGKAKEVQSAVQKSFEQARRNFVDVAITREGTLFHEVRGSHGASKVIIFPAKKGTGIIAGGPMRAVFEAMGVKDVVAKCHGSTNPYNLVRATLRALLTQKTPEDIAAKRGKTVESILGHEVSNAN